MEAWLYLASHRHRDHAAVHRGRHKPILLANLLQGSRSTFSCASFPSVFAFQEGMWDTHISALLGSPTVSVKSTNWSPLPQGQPECRTTHSKNLRSLDSSSAGFSTCRTLLAFYCNENTP